MSIFSMFGSGALPLELMTPTEVDVTSSNGKLTVQCNASDTFLIVQTQCGNNQVNSSYYPIFESRGYLVAGGKLLCEFVWKRWHSLVIGPGWTYTYYYDSNLILPDDSDATVDANYLFSAPALGDGYRMAIKLA